MGNTEWQTLINGLNEWDELSIKNAIISKFLNSVLFNTERDRRPEDFRKPQTDYKTDRLVIGHGSTRKE